MALEGEEGQGAAGQCLQTRQVSFGLGIGTVSENTQGRAPGRLDLAGVGLRGPCLRLASVGVPKVEGGPPPSCARFEARAGSVVRPQLDAVFRWARERCASPMD